MLPRLLQKWKTMNSLIINVLRFLWKIVKTRLDNTGNELEDNKKRFFLHPGSCKQTIIHSNHECYAKCPNPLRFNLLIYFRVSSNDISPGRGESR